jgi:predicted transcriptional regulator
MDSEKQNDIKAQIHLQIDKIEDVAALQLLQEAAATYASRNQEDILDKLTPSQLNRLNQSVEQAENGQTLTHKEVMEKAKKWLTK